MADYTIKRNDQGIRITIALEEWDPAANAGAGAWGPMDLTPYTTAKLLLKAPAADPPTLVWGNADIEPGGKVGYTFDADDLLVAAEYDGEVELRNAAGTIVETVPNGHDGDPKYFTVEVPEDLG